MRANNQIVIVRGRHPLEVSARYLAKKVSENLIHKGHATYLLTIPFETTHFAHALGFTSEYTETIKLLEKTKLNPSETLYFDFHNYKLPDDFGICKPNSDIFRFTVSTSSHEFKKKFGCIGYQLKGLDEDDGWYDRWYDDGLDGEDYEVINSVLYEIPAFFKRIPERVLERCGGRYISESSGIYNNQVVDFKKTREAGFLGKKIVRSLTENILELHKKYTHPVKKRRND